MRKSLTIVILTLLVGIVSAARAATPLSLDPVSPNPNVSYLDGVTEGLTPTSITLTESYRSIYVLSNGLVAYDHPVMQTDLFIKTKCGLSLDLWSSFPGNLHNTGHDYGTELDVALGYTRKIGDYNVSVGVIYYDLHRNLTLEGNDIVNLYAEVSRDFKIGPSLSFSPFIKTETKFKMNGCVKGDTAPRIGARFGWTATEYLTLAGQAYLLYDPGILLDTTVVGNVEMSAVWKLGKNVKLELPYARFVSPLTHVDDVRKPEFIYGAGLSVSF